MLLLQSESDSPLEHLAMEALLYSHPVPEEGILFLYRNCASVICGRNQNPLAECDPWWCQKQQIPVFRRISGGGTVFHDLGNLNYAFLVPREQYEPRYFSGLVLRALASLGVPAQADSHYGLFVNGRKISGTAFALNRTTALLHGCLLVHTDLSCLRRALTPLFPVQTTAIPSQRVPVANICDFAPHLTVEEVEDAILRQVPITGVPAVFPDREALEAKKEELSSQEWIWDRSPECTVELPSGMRRFPRGTLRMLFS